MENKTKISNQRKEPSTKITKTLNKLEQEKPQLKNTRPQGIVNTNTSWCLLFLWLTYVH